MTTQLGLYNAALTELGHRTLSSVAENTEARRVIDGVYSKVMAECLAMGSWNFAMETVMLDADTGVTPNFGFSEVFAKPTDWVRTFAISDDENFLHPLLRYYDDMNFWSADVSPIYARYVSNDTGLGLELTRWPETFARYFELELALRICMRLTNDRALRDQIRMERDRAKRVALNHDAMNDVQPKFAPAGSWTMSRGGAASSGDRGSRSNLTG